MKRYALRPAAGLFLLALLTLSGPALAAPDSPAPFDPYILTVIETKGAADVIVVLEAQADVSPARNLTTKAAKGRYVFEALTQVAARTQGPILSRLRARGAAFEPFWIQNMVRVRGADQALLAELAARPDVAEIFYEYPPVLDLEPPPPPDANPEVLEWNLDRVGADLVWGMGVTGTGAVVASLDTGVQWDHPALIGGYRPQVPGAPGRHDYNWWDGPGGSPTPLDYDSHGTHTVGIMMGANQVGMAPGAHWMACAGLGVHATPLDCFQFLLAPTKLDGSDPRPDLAPHVINNSWSSATDYQAIIETLYAAGIFYAKSAGNTGPLCGTITNPGQWPEVMASGNLVQGDYISLSSSRGPVTLGHDVLVKPDIAAPGTGIYSTVPGDAYAFKSGTSMASPHTAGAVALLVSAQPELAGQVDVLQMILKQTAEPKVDGQCPPDGPGGVPNNVWGYGILDAHGAVTMAQATELGRIEGRVTDSSTAQPLAGAALAFEDAATAWPLYVSSGLAGDYGRALPAVAYDVRASLYGYLPSTDPGVVVASGATTTLDIGLDPAPVWTVSGTVTESQTGEPLAAQVLFEETPITTGTDPATGVYSTGVAQGTWWMQATSPGHATEERLVAVDRDVTEDFGLPAIDNYYAQASTNACGPSFDWLDATGGASHCLSDDSYTLIALPQPFTFYGEAYDYYYLGSNGHVTFGGGWEKWSGPIPDAAAPNNGIYGFSTDLNPGYDCSQGTIYTDFIDDRYYVIQFDQVEHYPSGDPETFEIMLDLESGRVTVQFQVVSDASEAVVGVENAAGSEATQYAYADPALVTGGVAVEFWPAFGTPPPTGEAGAVEGAVLELGTGLPVEGAKVRAQAYSGDQAFTASTNPLGAYSMTLCADWYTMTAQAPGYHVTPQARVTILSGTLTTQDFQAEIVYPIYLPLVIKPEGS